MEVSSFFINFDRFELILFPTLRIITTCCETPRILHTVHNIALTLHIYP